MPSIRPCSSCGRSDGPWASCRRALSAWVSACPGPATRPTAPAACSSPDRRCLACGSSRDMPRVGNDERTTPAPECGDCSRGAGRPGIRSAAAGFHQFLGPPPNSGDVFGPPPGLGSARNCRQALGDSSVLSRRVAPSRGPPGRRTAAPSLWSRHRNSGSQPLPGHPAAPGHGEQRRLSLQSAREPSGDAHDVVAHPVR